MSDKQFVFVNLKESREEVNRVLASSQFPIIRLERVDGLPGPRRSKRDKRTKDEKESAEMETLLANLNLPDNHGLEMAVINPIKGRGIKVREFSIDLFFLTISY